MALSKALAVAENCSVCLSGFREPKVLPCCHSFCLHCLEEAHEKTKDKSLTCPQCRTQHQVGDVRLSCIHTHFVYRRTCIPDFALHMYRCPLME